MEAGESATWRQESATWRQERVPRGGRESAAWRQERVPRGGRRECQVEADVPTVVLIVRREQRAGTVQHFVGKACTARAPREHAASMV